MRPVEDATTKTVAAAKRAVIRRKSLNMLSMRDHP
jgi:hypothetical protein